MNNKKPKTTTNKTITTLYERQQLKIFREALVMQILSKAFLFYGAYFQDLNLFTSPVAVQHWL